MRKLVAAAMLAAPLVALAQEPRASEGAAPAPAQAAPALPAPPPPQGAYASPPQGVPPPQGQYAPPPQGPQASPSSGQYAPPPQYAPPQVPPPPGQYAPPPQVPQAYPPPGQYAPPPQYAPPAQYPQGYPPPPQYAPPAYPPPLPQPRPYQRDSWYIGFGFAGGDGEIQTGTDTSSLRRYIRGYVDRNPATVGLNFKVGATLTPRLLAGFDLSAIGASADDGAATVSLTVANYDLMATFFPWERGLFVRGGVGLSRLTLEVKNLPTSFGRVSTTDTLRGTNVAAGVGYAWWLGRHFNLTANLDLSNQWWSGNEPGQPTRSNLWTLGLGFDWF